MDKNSRVKTKQKNMNKEERKSIKCYARTNFPVRPTFTGRWDLRPFVSLIRFINDMSKHEGVSRGRKKKKYCNPREEHFAMSTAKESINWQNTLNTFAC